MIVAGAMSPGTSRSNHVFCRKERDMKKVISSFLALCLLIGSCVVFSGCEKVGGAADEGINKACDWHKKNK